MSRLCMRTFLESPLSSKYRLPISPSSAVQIRGNTYMFGSQTQVWSNVKQQSLDEAASKVCQAYTLKVGFLNQKHSNLF